MNAGQLWETTMNIETRTLLKISLEDLVLSDQIFTTLMGEVFDQHRWAQRQSSNSKKLEMPMLALSGVSRSRFLIGKTRIRAF